MAGCLALGWASAGLAQTPRDCVTAQLSEFGYAPGQETWVSLADAANAWRATAPDAIQAVLPEFQAQDALHWCRIIGLETPGLQVHWPARVDPLIFTDSDLAVDRAALIAAQTRVRDFVRDQFGVEVAGRFALVAASDGRGLTRLVNKSLRQQGKRGGRMSMDVDRFCNDRRVGGFAGRHFLALCWPAAGDGAARYDQLLKAGLLPVLAHEVMHQMQYELARDIPAQRKADGSDFLLGPAWMVEGAAEYLELQFVTGPIAFEGTALFNLQSAARRTRAPLSDLRKSGSVRGGRAYGTARFAAVLLAQKYGARTLFDYFVALGRLKDRELAFVTVFGQDMASFETEFESLRRDFGAAERYGRE